MGELGFINERVRGDNLFFLFFGVLVMGLSSWMLGLCLCLISVFFFLFFSFFVCVVVSWV